MRLWIGHQLDSLGSKVSKGDHHAVVITECLWHQHLWEGVERNQTVPQLTCEEPRCWDTSSVLCHLEIRWPGLCTIASVSHWRGGMSLEWGLALGKAFSFSQGILQENATAEVPPWALTAVGRIRSPFLKTDLVAHHCIHHRNHLT